MNFIQKLLHVLILIICLQVALCKKRHSQELQRVNSPLMASLDEDDEANADASRVSSSKESIQAQPVPTSKPDNETPTSSKLDSKPSKPNKSRKITLPPDYNKLEIPRPSAKQFLKNLFGDQYKDAAENIDGDVDFGPLKVEVDLNIRSIRDVDENNEEITVELDFIAQWIDAVIFFDNKDSADVIVNQKNYTAGLKSLDPVFLKSIWKPDIFIENVVSISRPELITKPIRLLFSPHGFFVFSTRVTVIMNCEMEFHYYPADTQVCMFRLRSYSYTNKDVNITWDLPGGPFLLDRNEHNFHVKLDIMDTLQEVEAEGLIEEDYRETYTILRFKISARRKLSYHLIQTYLPSTFFILITWLSFLVPATMVEARIGISMTTLLTLTSMFSSVRESTPVVSYVKAIDIWMVACIFFVFLTLLEFTILTWRRNVKPKLLFTHDDPDDEPSMNFKVKQHQYNQVKVSQNLETIEDEDLGPDPENQSSIDLRLKQIEQEKIEKFGFRAFSLLFVIFNLIYWPWLLISSEYYNWHVDMVYNSGDDE